MGNNLICGLIGFFLGGAAGGLFIGMSITKEYKKRIDDLTKENEELIEENRELAEKKREKREKAVEKQEKKVRSTIEELKSNYISREELGDTPITAEEFDDPFPQDTELAKHDPFGEDKEGSLKDEECSFPEESQEKQDQDEEGELDDIRIIDEDTFAEDMGRVDHEKLIFYQEDGVLTDERNEPITRQDRVIGFEAAELIDETDEDHVYVVNDLLDCMYEIEVDHSRSYYRDVLGV